MQLQANVWGYVIGISQLLAPALCLKAIHASAHSGKLHAWFPRLWGPPLITNIAKDAPPYTDVLWQMRRDAAISLALVGATVTCLAVGGRMAVHRLH